MKILGFVGSPRRGGNTDVLVTQALHGAAERGATVESIYLNDLKMGFCQACDACRAGDGYMGCVLDDDLTWVHEKMIEADGFVLGCPIYCFGPSAQAKTFLDRWYGLGYKEGGVRKSKLAGKQMLLVLVYGDDNPFTAGAINAYCTFRDEAQWTGVNITGVIYGSASAPGEVLTNESLMREALEAGARLAE